MGVNRPAASSVALLAEAYLDAVGQGQGIAAAERYFHRDVLYIVNGPTSPVDDMGLPALSGELHAALPWLGVYRGLDAVRGFLAHMHANLEVTGFGPRAAVGDQRRAAVFGWFALRSRSTGREARIAFSVLVEGRAGKISRYQFLENTFDVATAFQIGGGWSFAVDGTTSAVPVGRREP